MSPMEVEKIKEIGNGMDIEQKELIIKTFPTHILMNEIWRRNSLVESIFGKIMLEVNKVNENSTVDDIEKVINNCKDIFRENNNE